jgi:hypothetical protein
MLIPVNGEKFHFHLDQQHVWQQATSVAEHIDLTTLNVDFDEVNILDLYKSSSLTVSTSRWPTGCITSSNI